MGSVLNKSIFSTDKPVKFLKCVSRGGKANFTFSDFVDKIARHDFRSGQMIFIANS